MKVCRGLSVLPSLEGIVTMSVAGGGSGCPLSVAEDACGECYKRI